MKKIFIWWSMIIAGLISSAYAVNINLSVDKSQSDINNPITLKLEINNDKSENIKSIWIQWVKDNFDIVWQQNFQSSSSSIMIINWKQEIKTNIVQTLILSLKAKKAWTYTLWPAIVKIWNQEYKSNTVKVKITGTRIMIWNSQNSIQQLQQQNNKSGPSIQTTNNQTNNTQIQNKNKPIQAEKLSENHNNLIVFIIWILLLIWTWITMYVLKNNDNQENNTIWENDSFTENNIETVSNIETENKSETPLSFLENYGIEKPETKTYSEIMQEIKEKNIQLSDDEKKLIEKELIEKFKGMTED